MLQTSTAKRPGAFGGSRRGSIAALDRLLAASAIAVPFLVFAGVYAPAVGQGFIADDFGWIVRSRAATIPESLALFGDSSGFYRPLVGLSFAANYAMFGAEAPGYGWTNLLLALTCAALLALLLRTVELGRGAAALGAGLWLLNFHGINMALLWISGRTALLLIVGALLGTIGLLRGGAPLALTGLGLALFSKEEALVLPVIWGAAWLLGLVPRLRGRSAVILPFGTVLLTTAYLILRIQSGAMTPASAPAYYRFTLDPALLGRNVLEYVDRACTFAAAASLIGWFILRPARLEVRRTLLVFGALWIAAGYSLTLWLPVRSSLYACFPSVGAALMAAVFLHACWRGSNPARRTRALAAAIVIPLACAPAYIARTHRWTEIARFSTSVTADVVSMAPQWPDGAWLVLRDDRSRRANLQSAFGALAADAVLLHTGRTFRIWIEPPLQHAALAGLTPPCPECPRIELTLEGERLVGKSVDRSP